MTSLDTATKLHQHGRIEQAEKAYREILATQSGHPGALHLLGVIRQQQGRHEEALELIGRAIEIKPTVAVYHNNYGAALLSLERYEEAEASFHRALAIRPSYADALANLGMAEMALGKEEMALGSFRKVLHVDPRHRDARNRLATLFRDLARHEEAIRVFEDALADHPTAETYADFGSLLLTLGRTREAAASYRKAIGLKPDYGAAHFNLAQTLEELHETDETRQHFSRAEELQPDKPLWRLRSLICGPAVFESGEEIEEYCAGVEKAMEEWSTETPSPPAPLPQAGEGSRDCNPRRGLADGTRRVPATLGQVSLDDILEAGVFPNMAFSYHARDNRALKERFAALYEPYFQRQRTITAKCTSHEGDRKRIGIVVTQRHEGLFLRCMRGVIARLDRERFEPVMLCFPGIVGRLRTEIHREDLRFVTLDRSLQKSIARIRETACDLIYYWEVGSDAMNYFLPFARPAPVQCTGWGSTITSGVPAVDYFLSSQLIETPDSDEQYTETLWRSKTLFTCEPRLPPVSAASAAHFGLPDDRRLYVCFQNPLKIHPDTDALFAQILAADPQGLIVLSGRQPEVVRLLKQRFARGIHLPSPPALCRTEFIPYAGERQDNGMNSVLRSDEMWADGTGPVPATLAERIVFLPPQSFDDYCRLLQLADVILDTPHYGAGSSCYDLFSYNLPVVTLPGELIIGRITQACYRKMGVEDLVVHSPAEYVSRAVQVATDREYRKYVTERIAGSSDVLFNDLEAVREHERFFEEALSDVSRRSPPGLHR